MSKENEELELGEESLPSDYADALKEDKKENEEQLKELSGDYKVGYDQYLKEKDNPKKEDDEKDELIRDHRFGFDFGNKDSASNSKSKTTKEEGKKEIKPEQEVKESTSKPKSKIIIKEEPIKAEENKKVDVEEVKKEKTKTPEEQAKEIELANKVKEEREAKAEKEIENLKLLCENKNKLLAQKQKQQDLSYKFKAILGLNEKKPITADEYSAVYKEYEKALEEVASLTGKPIDQIKKDYLIGKEKTEDFVKVEKKLDESEKNLNKAEGELSPEKKSLYEKIKTMSAGKKIVAGVIVGGAIVVGAGAGIGLVTGMGLLQAFGLPSIITYSSYAGYAGAQALNVAGVAGVGGTVLSNLIYGEESLSKKKDKVDNLNEPKKQEEPKVAKPEIDSKIDFIPAEENIDNDAQENSSYEIGKLISEAKNISELCDILKEQNYSDKDIKQIKDLYDNCEYQPELDRNKEIEEIKDEKIKEKIKELINEKIIKKVADSSGIDQIN